MNIFLRNLTHTLTVTPSSMTSRSSSRTAETSIKVALLNESGGKRCCAFNRCQASKGTATKNCSAMVVMRTMGMLGEDELTWKVPNVYSKSADPSLRSSSKLLASELSNGAVLGDAPPSSSSISTEATHNQPQQQRSGRPQCSEGQ